MGHHWRINAAVADGFSNLLRVLDTFHLNIDVEEERDLLYIASSDLLASAKVSREVLQPLETIAVIIQLTCQLLLVVLLGSAAWSKPHLRASQAPDVRWWSACSHSYVCHVRSITSKPCRVTSWKNAVGAIGSKENGENMEVVRHQLLTVQWSSAVAEAECYKYCAFLEVWGKNANTYNHF